jgi:Ca2+-binding EF-hand superfamily protein
VKGLSVDADDKELLQHVFTSMDTDSDGNISRAELQAALSSENKELAEALMVAIKEEDRTAGIDFAAFKKGADQVCPPCFCSRNPAPDQVCAHIFLGGC